VLKSDISAAKLCSFLNFNVNSELGKFSVSGNAIHNGAPVNLGLLNEKWEGLALVPANQEVGGRDAKDEYYLFASSDNDFISQKGEWPHTGIIATGNETLANKNLFEQCSPHQHGSARIRGSDGRSQWGSIVG
jgi:hypothetical protein